jgi:hypothetical protein
MRPMAVHSARKATGGKFKESSKLNAHNIQLNWQLERNTHFPCIYLESKHVDLPPTSVLGHSQSPNPVLKRIAKQV